MNVTANSPDRTCRSNIGGSHDPRRLIPDPVPAPQLGGGDTVDETDAAREERIAEQWARDDGFDRTTEADAIWFIAHAPDWADVFMKLVGWDQWPRDIPELSGFEIAFMSASERRQMDAYLEAPEPMSTTDAIEWLAAEHETARQRVQDDPSPDSIRDERNLHIACESLRARYARTGDNGLGW